MYTAPVALVSSTASVTYAVDGVTACISISLENPVPSLGNVFPSMVTSPSSTITVTGSGFIPTSQILVDARAVPTTWQSSSQLTTTLLEAAGTAATLPIQVRNPDPGSTTSATANISVDISQEALSVVPASLSGGAVTLTVTDPGVTAGSIVSLNGMALNTVSISGDAITASGYLAPWLAGGAVVSVTGSDGATVLAQATVPITPTAVSFDAAARFATQAAFGPRPDVVLHIQQIGLQLFLAEQLGEPVGTYNVAQYSTVREFYLNLVPGNSLLRLRTAWALQTYIPETLFYQNQILSAPWEETLERDAFTNYRQILKDAASDPNVAGRLNMPGNTASTDPNVHPNQNFARESMQLFSIGTVMLNEDGTVQTDSNGVPIPAYGQDTVLAMSRVFTGWDFPTPVNPLFTMYNQDYSQPLVPIPGRHDMGAKTLFGSVQLPAGQDAEQDRDAAIEAIMRHQNTAPFVSRLLIQRFVKSQPSPAYVKRIADVFRNNGNGVSGDMTAVIQAILLDPEARAGDTDPQATDGFLQDPVYSVTFLMSVLQTSDEDDQSIYIPGALGEDIFNTESIFSYFSPSYVIPGSKVNSPEFQLFTNFTAIQRSQFLWSVASLQQPGFNNGLTGWLYSNFTTLPTMLDALNHLLYHGNMPQSERAVIEDYCNGIADPKLQLESAVFLALNSDSYTVIN